MSDWSQTDGAQLKDDYLLAGLDGKAGPSDMTALQTKNLGMLGIIININSEIVF